LISSHRKTIYESLGREPVHPFPARMAPGIVLEVVASAAAPLRVLDPMVGSGTVLALARAKGHYAVGVDTDPLAVLIARVWTRAIDPVLVRWEAEAVLEAARANARRLLRRDAYPAGADDETRRFCAYWFDVVARRQLASLAAEIAEVSDAGTRDALWCGFSRLIIAKQAGASLAMDLSHSRPHRAFSVSPILPFDRFLAAVDRVVDNCLDRRQRDRGPASRVVNGDARSLPLADESIDLVLTSPPYLNAIDYLRCSKFSLVWMGHRIADLRRIRAGSVGTEAGFGGPPENPAAQAIVSGLRLRPRLARRDDAILTRYAGDMMRALSETARVLASNGRAVYVVGENMVRGTYIPNAAILTAAAELAGLVLQKRRTRTLPANRRYLPPPGSEAVSYSMDTRMRREVVVAFSKATAR
jgi:SAM-dependent methyltransferase